MKDKSISTIVLIVVIVILFVVLFSMVQGIFGANASCSFEPFPTTAPMETCFNGGLSIRDGCSGIYLPLLMK